MSGAAKRSICCVTGTRAEYGLLAGLMHEIAESGDFELQIVATAMHLEPAFGYTVDQILADGFRVDAAVPIDLSRDDPASIARATGHAVLGLADAFETLQPDLIVLLGDRFETLAAATTAALLRIPVAHIHGGEVSEGAIDDAMRHAITKLSHLHFVAAEDFRRRVIQMGEMPERVFTVGAPGLDRLARHALPDRTALAERVELELDRTLLLVTYHPATLGDADTSDPLEELLVALDAFPDTAIVITKANADAGGRAINARLEAYASTRRGRVALVASLGSDFYLCALREAAAVIGNSSSGIIEAPAAGTPTVNVGRRQDGRARSASIIDTPERAADIVAAIRRALDPAMQGVLATQSPAYGRPGNAARLIFETLESVELDGLLMKRFNDLPASAESTRQRA